MSIERLVSTSASLLAPSLFNPVAIYTQQYIPIFRNASIVKDSVNLSAKAMNQPLETGTTIIDHRVIQPVEIELFIILTALVYRNTFDEMKQVYDLGTLLIVQTRSGTYNNMFIDALPNEEDPEKYDAINLVMKLKEALFVVSKTEPISAKPANSSTKNRGNIETSATPPAKEKSVLASFAGV